MSTLNRRNELTSSCRHARKFLLKNVIHYLIGDNDPARVTQHATHVVSIVLYFQISLIVTVISGSCLMIASHGA